MEIQLGHVLRNGKLRNVVTLPWDNIIGMLVVGRPGSGKSHVIASMLTQYAVKGVDLVIAEYNADSSNPQSLLYRVAHLENAMLRPPVTSGEDIVELLKWTKQQLVLRQTGKADRTPLMIVIDEFFQFAASVKPPESNTTWKEGDARSDEGETVIRQKAPSFWEDLIASQADMRKNNIRLILAAQETSSTATSNIMRQVRDMFRFKLIMNLSPKGADLLDIKGTAAQQVINRLKPGQIYVNGHIVVVPFPIKPQWIEKARTSILPRQHTAVIAPVKNDWSEEEAAQYIKDLLALQPKYRVLRDVQTWPLQTTEDVIELLLGLGWSKNKLEQLFSTARSSVRQIVKDIETANSLQHTNAE